MQNKNTAAKDADNINGNTDLDSNRMTTSISKRALFNKHLKQYHEYWSNQAAAVIKRVPSKSVVTWTD